MTKTNKAPDTVSLAKPANGHGEARLRAGRKRETVNISPILTKTSSKAL
ncbi:MAG: hypothetical protein HN616_08450 [Proteobacteria bacterium]|nr:hypothetical protein [Pseudomonadota bacterium]MBT7625480.1 hypothetical protein [Pseudomonadota bacterium]